MKPPGTYACFPPGPRGSICAAAVAAACVISVGGGLRATDSALVPLEEEARDFVEALERIEAGRMREGLELLQEKMSGALRAPSSAQHGIVRVPLDMPTALPPLKEALKALAAQPSPAASGDGAAQEAARPDTTERRYLPAHELAEACLSALPAEARAAYREMYEAGARSLVKDYRERGDRTALERAALEHFFTASGAAAAEVLGDALLEEGNAARASFWWRKALRQGEPAAEARPRLTLKLLEALRASGAAREAGAVALELPAGQPAAARLAVEVQPSRWGGEIPPDPPDLPAAGRARFSWDSWVWSRDGVWSRPAGPQPVRRLSLMSGDDRAGGPYFPFVPAIEGSSAFISGVFGVFRLDARPGGGSLVSEWKKPTQNEQHRYKERGDSPLYPSTLWRRDREPCIGGDGLPSSILVTHYVSDVVEPQSYLGYDIFVEMAIRSLIAYDAETGEVLWRTGDGRPVAPGPGPGGLLGPDARRNDNFHEDDDGDEDVPIGAQVRGRGFQRLRLGPEDAVAIPREFSYTSPAIVKRGLVVAGGWVQRGYINSAVRAHDLRTGKLVWETLLSGTQVEPTMFGEMAREPFAGAILEDGGIVYYLTQAGTIAALDLETGRVRWLSTYDTIEIVASNSPKAETRTLAWDSNPLLLLGHILVATPRDSVDLYAFDTGLGPAGPVAAGKVLWRFSNPVDGRDQAPLRDLLGFHRGFLYLMGPGELAQGPGEVAALDLRGLDPAGRLGPGAGSPPLVGPLRLSGPVPGRGVLTRAGILLATEDGIRLVSLELTEERPFSAAPFRRSDWGSYPGRLDLAGGMIYMTSRELLSAYEVFVPEAAR